MTSASSPNESALPTLSARASTTQLLWSKTEVNASLLDLSAARPSLQKEELLIIEHCQRNLVLARKCISGLFKRHFLFWEIIHEVDELLLLILPEEMLATRALDVLAKFDAKISDPVRRQLWLGTEKEPGPLKAAVAWLSGN